MSTIRVDQFRWATKDILSCEMDFNTSSKIILEPFTTTRLIIEDPVVLEYLPLTFVNQPYLGGEDVDFSSEISEEIENAQDSIGKFFDVWPEVDRLLYVNDALWFILPGSTGAIPCRNWERWAKVSFSESASRTSGVDFCSIGLVTETIVLEWLSVDEAEFEYRIFPFEKSVFELVLDWIKANFLTTMLKHSWVIPNFPLIDRLMLECATSKTNFYSKPKALLPEIDCGSEDWGLGLTLTSEWWCHLNVDEPTRIMLIEALSSQYWNDHLKLLSELGNRADSLSNKVISGKSDSPIILHVPHSSTHIPLKIVQNLDLTQDFLAFELLQMTDSYTDTVARIAVEEAKSCPWIFQNCLSRLVVDPERFPDEREDMESVGMGAVYSKTHDQNILRSVSSSEKEDLLTEYFYPYAEHFSQLVSERLEACGFALIIDVHSYPSKVLPYELNGEDARPPICLGIDDFHTSNLILESASVIFSKFGDVGVNSPFSGTYVPLDYFRIDKRVQSIMIEIRRDLYMDEMTGVPNCGVLQELGVCISKMIDSVSLDTNQIRD
jgi:N-formylglutamate deformylase